MRDDDAAAGRTVRLATWNIHGGVGGDGRYDAQRIIAVLREMRADVIALQEVASLALHGDFLRAVRKGLDVDILTGPTLTRRDADFGNAILTRYPIVAAANIELTVARHEPRNAIDAHLDVHGTPLRVIATHLGLRPAERREQVRRLLAAVDHEPDHCSVLMGDLNEWYLWGRPLRWLHARYAAVRAPATFPARRPVLALDRIWAHPAQRLRGVDVHDSALARIASDHLPLVARFALPDALRSAAV